MKKPIEAYVAAVLAGGCVIMAMVTGCSSSSGGSVSPGSMENGGHFRLDVGQGRKADCWYVENGLGDGQTGGPTCDWVGFHEAYDGPTR